jgi:hypothetical protein
LVMFFVFMACPSNKSISAPGGNFHTQPNRRVLVGAMKIPPGSALGRICQCSQISSSKHLAVTVGHYNSWPSNLD